MATKANVREEAKRLMDELPADATWEDAMYKLYFYLRAETDAKYLENSLDQFDRNASVFVFLISRNLLNGYVQRLHQLANGPPFGNTRPNEPSAE